MPDKPTRLPWATEPYVDRRAAEQRALTAASYEPGDPNNPAVKAWAQKAFDDEIRLVENAPDQTRNTQLFKSAANLFEIVAAGALDETTVTSALVRASDPWNYNAAGTRMCLGTIASGRRHGFDDPRDLSKVGKYTNGFTLDTEAVQSVDLTDTLSLERGFWTRRDSLQNIYLAALSRMCSPWAVLGYCAARVLTLVRPNCVLPPLIGGQGSLNWFCAVAAQSGGGKGSAHAVSKELVREYIFTRNLGSGEGLIDAYCGKPTDENPTGTREAVMFVADEIDGMSALGLRSGSTLMSTLRSAFSGETLGFSYRSSKTHLESHSYRMTLVVNVQPARAGALLDDQHGGTLQRFMWFPGTDPRVTTEIPLMPESLDMPPISSWLYPQVLEVPYETVELIRDERVRSNSGMDDDHGHAYFIREKFAYALAVLDGRDVMTEDDWALAGIASRVSDHTRDWVAYQLRNLKDEEATERGRLQGVSSMAADEEKTLLGTQRTSRIAKWALAKIKEEGEISARKLTQAMASKDRPYLTNALELLASSGLIEQRDTDNKTGRPGKIWRLMT